MTELNGGEIHTCSGPPEQPQQSTADAVWQRRLIAMVALVLLVFAILVVPYYRLAKRVDQQLAAGLFQHTFTYYAAPEILSVGDSASATEIAASFKRSGYSIVATDNAVVVKSDMPVEVQFAEGKISSIVDLSHRRRLGQFELPPQLLANLSDTGRAKHTLVRYSDMPAVLVHAIVSAEDKRFFQHSGFDPFRIAKALYVDLREHRKQQGASTISMQLARNVWLGRDKSWERKTAEVLVTLHLERKLTKEQILEQYCNMVYLGGQGTFSINGFGEASQAYFNKDIHQLSLTESATLAGLIQRPSHLNPLRFPDRALKRRNAVLRRMRGNKYISQPEYLNAVASPLGLRPGMTELSQAEYFFDAASDQGSKELEERTPHGAVNVYTTIDLRLERAAEQAVESGMRLVDKELASRRQGSGRARGPQVALIAIDPHTGEVKALCGGRDYIASQLDRVFSSRPPGSAFKPFVYTAALNTAIVGGGQVFTPFSPVDDSPTTFQFGNQTYSPANFKNEFWGRVTLRQALAHSLNAATVKVGQMVGFDKVVAVARLAGMNKDIKPTPAVALGAYQVTPFEIARAYTMFANRGVRVQPTFISAIRDQTGAALYDHHPQTRAVLDPRVAFLMVDMLQEVLRSGTAAGVRARGFWLPAAGKTGTSHDGWFVGFTSQLLCVVWVGFDDYGELGLEGARSALPIWTEFMMQAARYKQYGEAKPFVPPPGVVRVGVDPGSGRLAGPLCPNDVTGYFIDGTQPTLECDPQEIEIIPTADGGVIERSVVAEPARPPEVPHQN